jgi:hypothetical protein
MIHLTIARRGGTGSRVQPVPKGNQDYGGVAVPVPIHFDGFDQSLYFGRRQVLSGAELGVQASFRSNCSIYLSWATSFIYDFGMKSGPPGTATVCIFHPQPQT